MGYSKVEIANLALAQLGVSDGITSLDETSNEARMCKRLFDPVLDAVLADFSWTFATRTVALAVVAEEPTVEWLFSYRIPADAVAIRRVQNGVSAVDTASTRVAYRLGADDDGGLLYASVEDAVVEYAVRPANTTVLPADVAWAVVYLLASELAPSITQGDARKYGLVAFQKYKQKLSEAKARDANLGAPPAPADGAFVLARG